MQRPVAAGLILVVVALVGGCLIFPPHPPQPPPPPPLADEVAARSILKGLAVAQFNYSIKRGGMGVSNFANDPSLIGGMIHPETAKAIITQGQEPIPSQGYIFELRDTPPHAGFASNFLFIARPAPGFSGRQFQIDKTETIKETP